MNFSQSAPHLFSQGIEQIKEYVDTVHMLKKTTNTEFKPKKFFKGAPLKQAGPGGADIRHKPTINPITKTKEISVQEGPSQRQPPRSGSMNTTSNSQLKSYSVFVAINTCIRTCISCCTLFNKQQSFSQYSQSLTQFSLAMGPGKACTQQSSRAQQLNRPPMHGVNQLETNNIRLLYFRGNTRVQDQFLEATIPGMSTSPTASLSEGCIVNEHRGPQTLTKESNCSGGPTTHTRVPVQSVPGPQKDGSHRPVINVCQLNQFVIWEHFKMENIHLVEHLIQEGDWTVKINLKDA